MHPQEKMAWYMLAVMLLALVSYSVLLTLTEKPDVSSAAFAILGLLGFAGIFNSGKSVKVIADEHDQLISLKATRAAFQVFWLYFVGYCMLSMPPIHSSSSVPSYYFGRLIMTGLIVMLSAQSIAILVYYRADSIEDETLVDRFRKMAMIRKSGLWILALSPLVMVPMGYAMNMINDGETPGTFALIFGFTTCAAFASVYWGFRRQLRAIARSEGLEMAAARACKRGDVALLLGLIGMLGGTGLIWLLADSLLTAVKIPQVIFYALCCGILGQGFAAFITNPSEMDQNTSREAGNA